MQTKAEDQPTFPLPGQGDPIAYASSQQRAIAEYKHRRHILIEYVQNQQLKPREKGFRFDTASRRWYCFVDKNGAVVSPLGSVSDDFDDSFSDDDNDGAKALLDQFGIPNRDLLLWIPQHYTMRERVKKHK